MSTEHCHTKHNARASHQTHHLLQHQDPMSQPTSVHLDQNSKRCSAVDMCAMSKPDEIILSAACRVIAIRDLLVVADTSTFEGTNGDITQRPSPLPTIVLDDVAQLLERSAFVRHVAPHRRLTSLKFQSLQTRPFVNGRRSFSCCHFHFGHITLS